MIGETVTVIHPGETTDGYGNDKPSWADDDVTRVAVEHCGVAPGDPRPEAFTPGRSPVEIAWTIYMPTGTAVSAADRLEIRGEIHEVDGHPDDWRDALSSWRPGIVVRAKRVTG